MFELKNKFQSNNKVDIIYGDILNYTPRIPSYCVFSNIPFNITSEILNKFLSDKKNEKMFLIMQYEPFIKYAGNPYGAETLRSMLYKPFSRNHAQTVDGFSFLATQSLRNELINV